MKCIDPFVTWYVRGTFRANGVVTTSDPSDGKEKTPKMILVPIITFARHLESCQDGLDQTLTRVLDVA